MKARGFPGYFELLVLLAVMRLGDEAYGVPIAHQVEESTGRQVALASVYAALERLQEKGLVVSSLGEATAARGGRAKRYFQVTRQGIREAHDARRTLSRLWARLPQLQGGQA